MLSIYHGAVSLFGANSYRAKAPILIETSTRGQWNQFSRLVEMRMNYIQIVKKTKNMELTDMRWNMSPLLSFAL